MWHNYLIKFEIKVCICDFILNPFRIFISLSQYAVENKFFVIKSVKLIHFQSNFIQFFLFYLLRDKLMKNMSQTMQICTSIVRFKSFSISFLSLNLRVSRCKIMQHWILSSHKEIHHSKEIRTADIDIMSFFIAIILDHGRKMKGVYYCATPFIQSGLI